MKQFLIRTAALAILSLTPHVSAGAVALDLDSVAAMGRFPNFCIRVYRWADKVLNTKDSAYIESTPYSFNTKISEDTFFDSYTFGLPNHIQVDMVSDPTTSAGLYLSFKGLSIGYDINISKLVRTTASERTRYGLNLNTNLICAETYYVNNTLGSKIIRFGDRRNLDLPYHPIAVKGWGISAYYFFNHKRYSQSAAFSLGEYQTRSDGSFYAGLSVAGENFDIDFTDLPQDLCAQLPEWPDKHYRYQTHTAGVIVGYGYNWVFARNWLLGASASPVVGLRRGFINSTREETDFAFNMRGRLSVSWHSDRWFAGIQGSLMSSLLNNRQTIFLLNNVAINATMGYRFNIF